MGKIDSAYPDDVKQSRTQPRVMQKGWGFEAPTARGFQLPGCVLWRGVIRRDDVGCAGRREKGGQRKNRRVPAS